MRTIEKTNQFKKDYKRESKGQYRHVLDEVLLAILQFLVKKKTLPKKYRDHPLSGEWSDHRDCHVKPDLVLIYRFPDSESLQLVRLGSHSELGF